MERFLDIALIITSVALIISVILQIKGAGLGVLGYYRFERDFLYPGNHVCIHCRLMNFG
jgi:hypothetical protein